MPTEGQVLAGKYRIERFLSAGGFASVWAARNLRLDRPVALKILADNLVRKPGFVARFRREARIASQGLHPAFVLVEDIEETAEGIVFLVMELLEGQTLEELLEERGPLPRDEAVALGAQLLDGLAAAHRRGVIHRDVKPSNVFLSSPGRPGPRLRILDLGLAREREDEERITGTGQRFGTPHYAAPEVVRGREPARWTPRSDVFSAGLVMYKMLVGTLPTHAGGEGLAAFETQAKFYSGLIELPGPRHFDPAIPVELDAVVSRAVSPLPPARFADAGEMLAALEAAAPGAREARVVVAVEPLPRPSPPQGAPARARSGRRRASVWALGAALLAAGALAFLTHALVSGVIGSGAQPASTSAPGGEAAEPRDEGPGPGAVEPMDGSPASAVASPPRADAAQPADDAGSATGPSGVAGHEDAGGPVRGRPGRRGPRLGTKREIYTEEPWSR